MKYSILSDQNWLNCIDNIQYFSTFSITSITSIYEFSSKRSVFDLFIYFREFVYLSRFFTNILRYRIFSRILHSVRMITFIFAIIFASDFLSFSFVFCDHVSENHFMTHDFKTLYSMHLIENIKILRCNWFTQTKKAQENYHLRKHELKIKNKLKEKMKQLTKQKKKTRLIKKRTKKYTCRRCKTIKFDNNIKLHEHIRIRHVKKSKSKFAQQFV